MFGLDQFNSPCAASGLKAADTRHVATPTSLGCKFGTWISVSSRTSLPWRCKSSGCKARCLHAGTFQSRGPAAVDETDIVVLVPGQAALRRTWDMQARLLADGCSLYASLACGQESVCVCWTLYRLRFFRNGDHGQLALLIVSWTHIIARCS